jgi:hypothetical protein
MARALLDLLVAFVVACSMPRPRDDELPPSIRRIADRYRAKPGERAPPEAPADAPGSAGADDDAWGGSGNDRPEDRDDPDIPGMEHDQAARQSMWDGDSRTAVTELRLATGALLDCPEYGYNLGAAQANLAIEVVHAIESEALGLSGESGEAKRRALQLMDEGRRRFDDEAEQERVRLDAEMGLEGADEILENEEALLAALRRHAARQP